MGKKKKEPEFRKNDPVRDEKKFIESMLKACVPSTETPRWTLFGYHYNSLDGRNVIVVTDGKSMFIKDNNHPDEMNGKTVHKKDFSIIDSEYVDFRKVTPDPLSQREILVSFPEYIRVLKKRHSPVYLCETEEGFRISAEKLDDAISCIDPELIKHYAGREILVRIGKEQSKEKNFIHVVAGETWMHLFMPMFFR